MQDTLLAAWKHRDSFRGESSRRTWLIAILRRKIIDEQRRKKRRPSLTVLPNEPEWFSRRGRWLLKPQKWDDDPTAKSEHQEFQQALARCIDGLPGDQAEAFKLKAVRDRTTEECCNQLGVSASNLGVRLYRARLALRRCLELGWFKPISTQRASE